MANDKSNSIDVRPQQQVPRPRIIWENGSYTMDDILRRFPLPNVVECDSALSDVSREHSNFDFLQPMLLYNKRRCMKVIACSLDLNKTKKTAVEVGNHLLVPEDYKGWFAVLDSKKVNASVPHYAQVDLLSQSDCHTFLIGGTENVEAVQKQKGEKEHVTRYLYPGEVLKMGNTYIAQTTVRNSIFKKSLVKETKFLLCIDQNDREILLPFGSKGKFYVIKTKNKRPPIRIMQMKDIINNVQLPCVVRLLFGLEPSSPCVFTGLMVLKHSFEEFSAVASSIVNLRNILLEIPADIPLKFKVAAAGKNIEDNVGFRNAFRLCQEKAESYMRNIKVSHGISSADDVREDEAPPPPRTRNQEPLPEELRDNQQSLVAGFRVKESDVNPQPQHFGTQFQLPAFRGKGDNPQRSSYLQVYHENESPPSSSGKSGEHPSSTRDHPVSYPGPETSQEPPPRPPRCLLSSSETSTPTPPAQSAKPHVLERVVTCPSAPPSMVSPNQLATQSQPSHFSSKILVNNTIGQSQPTSMGPQISLAKTPAKKQAPETPTKPAGKSISRQKQIRISVKGTYLSVPIYLTPQYIESESGSAEDDTVLNKMKFWKNLDSYSRDIATREASKEVSPNQETKVTPTTDSKQSNVDGRKKATTVYENIEDLKVFAIKTRQQSLDTNDDDAASDDVTYEMPSFQREDAFYEDLHSALPDSGQGLTYEEIDLIRPRNQSSQRQHIDSGINMGDEEENDVNVIARMTGPEVCDKLKAAGLKKETIELFRKNKVDGRVLLSYNEETLKSDFPKLKNIEIKKIGLFIRGLKHI